MFKGDERLGRNYVIVKITEYAGKERKFGLPLIQCALVKSLSGATGNESDFELYYMHTVNSEGPTPSVRLGEVSVLREVKL